MLKDSPDRRKDKTDFRDLEEKNKTDFMLRKQKIQSGFH